MDLKTQYCGLTLKHPLVVGASPLADNVDTVRWLEEAGASAIVMRSLFEEQITREQLATAGATDPHTESFAEATTYLPEPAAFQLGPDEYLEQLGRAKAAVGVPVFGSLNGTTPGGWVDYAALIEQAGADGLELNVYAVPIDPEQSASAVEDQLVSLVEAVRGAVTIPVAVKLSPFHTAPVHLARRLKGAGADALVLFNRHFQPDVDIENLELQSVYLSSPSELTLRLRWLGLLSALAPGLGYAATGGVHDAASAIKALMCGADTVQLVTRLLTDSPGALRMVLTQVEQWLEEHEYESVGQLRGSMNYHRGPEPGMYLRSHYMKLLQSWR